jgi:transposase
MGTGRRWTPSRSWSSRRTWRHARRRAECPCQLGWLPRIDQRAILEWIIAAKRPRRGPAGSLRPPGWLPRASGPTSGANQAAPSLNFPIPLKSVFPTFGRFLLLALLMGMIRRHDHHRRSRPRAALAGHPAAAAHSTTPLRRARSHRRPRLPGRHRLQLRTGVPWRLLPTRELGCGSPVTCWRRLRDWQRVGVWQRLHQLLLDELGRDGRLDWSRASLDSVSVRAKRGAA